jgi:capsular polysaccharide biosynthesis protein
MDLNEFATILLRRWWLIIGLPLVVFVFLVWWTSDPPYNSSFRASVIMPGDTEIPGNSERPELMVLDDLPELVSSQVFAEGVTTVISASAGPQLSADEVHDSLSADRYSRILTVDATNDSKVNAEAIAIAAESVLPGAINQYLIADSAAPANVNIIDPAGEASLDNENRWLIIGVETLVAAAAAVGLALAYHGLTFKQRAVPTS